jgi:uncharacterized phage protein gp47/JayE
VTLDADGLTIKTQGELEDEIKEALRASPDLNPNGRINLGPDSVLGVLASIFSDKLAELYQLVQAVYASQYPSSAEGASLALITALQGVTRKAASASTAVVTFSGVGATVIPIGTVIRDPDRPTVEWVSTTEAIIGVGDSTATVQASTTGPIAANAGTLTELVTPIVGVNALENEADATLGTVEEEDAALRQRRIDLLFAIGSSTPPAILSAVLAVPGVVEASVFENPSTVTNDFGVPAKNIEVVVDGGDDAALAQAIYDNKAAGMGTYTATADGDFAEDVNGQDVDIAFSRPVPVEVFVYVEAELSSTAVSSTAEDLKTALAAFGDQSKLGQKVIRSKLFTPAYSVPGVANVRRLGVSGVDAAGALAAATTLDDVTVAFREKASFDTTRIVVVEV